MDPSVNGTTIPASSNMHSSSLPVQTSTFIGASVEQQASVIQWLSGLQA